MSLAERLDEIQRQQQWDQGQARRFYHSKWAIDTLRTKLPPEHIALANRLVELQAISEGVGVKHGQKVDCGNGTEISLHARIDARYEMTGYEQAALTRHSRKAVKCCEGIAQIDSFDALRRRCGFAVGSNRALVTLVQTTLIALQAYRDECDAQLSTWAVL